MELSGFNDEISFNNLDIALLPELFNELSAQIIRFASAAEYDNNDINTEAYNHIRQKYYLSMNDYQLPVKIRSVLTQILNEIKNNNQRSKSDQKSISKRLQHERNDFLLNEVSSDQFNTLPMFLQVIINNAVFTTPGFTGNRYSDMIYDIASLFLCRCGPKQYEIFQPNMSLPEISMVRNYIDKKSMSLNEGVLYIKELKDFLIKNDYPLEVGIFEDGTKVNFYFAKKIKF